MAIDAYLIKHKLLSIEECYQEYQKPFQNGTISNKDLVRKLLPKIDKTPRYFYRALYEAVNDPKQDKHPGHSALLKLLPADMVLCICCLIFIIGLLFCMLYMRKI